MPRRAAAAGAPPLAGRIHHSVCRWCYDRIPLDDLCAAAKEMGLQSVEILPLDQLPVLKKHGLINAMISGVPRLATAYSKLAMVSSLAKFPATRQTNRSPLPLSKAYSGAIRESAQLRIPA